ncbi:MAG: choice-of-anchor tandem repeat GloVer-containing protein [Terriglobales bacterium]
MQLTSLLRSAATLAGLSVLSLLLFQTARAQTETDLYNFCSVGGCADGETPNGPLVVGTNGAFYATSGSGGTSGSGTVFGLYPEPTGGCGAGINTGNGWCEFVLYNFCSLANCTDGNLPIGSVSYLNGHFRTPGNLYGTTFEGGSHNAGVVFEISSEPIPSGCPSGSNTSGGWCETVLYSFCSFTFEGICTDGNNPFGNIVEDSAGNLYGTVKNGVFQLSPNQQGGWDSELIYADNFVIGGLAIDSADNLYGIDVGNVPGLGNVFKISLSQTTYPHENIYTFKGTSKNGIPNGPPAVDSAGNVYGTTFGTTGGGSLPGTVWKLTPVTTGKKTGTYTKKDLHVFTAEKGGQNPGSGVLLDSSGNIYSTAAYGGDTVCQIGPGCGTVFELVANGDTYEYKVLWRFNGTDGAAPYSSPILNSAGDLFGVTSAGGANNLGTMYEVTP